MKSSSDEDKKNDTGADITGNTINKKCTKQCELSKCGFEGLFPLAVQK